MIPLMDQFESMDSYEALCFRLGTVTPAEMEQETLEGAQAPVATKDDLDDCIPY